MIENCVYVARNNDAPIKCKVVTILNGYEVYLPLINDQPPLEVRHTRYQRFNDRLGVKEPLANN